MRRHFLTLFLSVAVLLCAAAQEADTEREPSAAGANPSAEERYRITDVEYSLDGRTKPYALDRRLDIDRERVFATRQELDAYLDYIRQALSNQRVLQGSSLDYTIGGPLPDGILPVAVRITAEDTWNIFPLPYPKYNSNDGFEFKLKVKDYNFFGSMEVMNLDLVFYQEDEGASNNVGLGFDFSIPFALGVFDATWSTDAGIDYTFGDSRPGFSFKTGLDIAFPMRLVTFHLVASQKIEQDLDYEDYGDELFLTEFVEFNAPILLLDSTGLLDKVRLKPYVSLTFNWDADGMAHEDLVGPSLGFGAELSAGKADWAGNFRHGLKTGLTQSFGYNLGKENDRLSPRVSAEAAGYYATEHVGFAGRLYGFTYYGMDILGADTIGARLRGIRDNEELYHSGQTETSAAIVLNLDVPVKVVQTDWRGWGKRLFKREMPSWFRLLDFELQISPFIDAALTRNTVTGRTFHPKDGFYSAGLEMLVFPSRMRSIQVRLSAGFDLGTHISDAEWRSETSPEIEFGVGLHY